MSGTRRPPAAAARMPFPPLGSVECGAASLAEHPDLAREQPVGQRRQTDPEGEQHVREPAAMEHGRSGDLGFRHDHHLAGWPGRVSYPVRSVWS